MPAADSSAVAPASPSAAPAASTTTLLPVHATHVPVPKNDHPMRTRGKSGFRIPTTRLNLHVSPTLSPIPKTYKTALLDPNWATAMKDEFTALLENQTWQLVHRPSNTNIVSGKGFFAKSFILMVALLVTKLDGFSRVILNKRDLTTMKHFLPLLSKTLFRLFSVLMFPLNGLFTN
jgi:hypothetical protein